MSFNSKHSLQKKSLSSSLDKNFFSYNRKRLLAKMAPDSIAMFAGNYPIYTNGDGVLPYVPNHDLWYFTGIEQDKTILLLVKSEKKGNKEILFIKPRSPKTEVWDGTLLSQEKAMEISGIKTIALTTEWESMVKNYFYQIHTVYINLQEHARAPFYRNRNHDLYEYCHKHYPLYTYKRLAPLVHSLRMIKSLSEITEIRKATTVSHKALKKILPLIKDGVREKDIEAEMTAVYIRHNGEPAFSLIVGSGVNSCTIHYISNHDTLSSNQVLLIDGGARLGRYSADITRVFPIRDRSGQAKFTSRQRQVYESVFRVLQKTSNLIKPGLAFKHYQKKSTEFIKTELLSLGVLTKKDLNTNPQAYQKYFMHGVSHWLGLDVHDVGGYDDKFKVGMVLTCEPGIYIPEEKIGIRLENNFWIKSSKETENLSAEIPLAIDEVYQWMNEK